MKGTPGRVEGHKTGIVGEKVEKREREKEEGLGVFGVGGDLEVVKGSGSGKTRSLTPMPKG